MKNSNLENGGFPEIGGFLMSFSQLSNALEGNLFSWEGERGFSSVAIDSRAVIPGGLFVALKGCILDGHNFVEAAFKAGQQARL
jgi:UDP-N-acetylmuramoyl-L-alanyl-D-glutamate--2,6-diaminopimelate ligase